MAVVPMRGPLRLCFSLSLLLLAAMAAAQQDVLFVVVGGSTPTRCDALHNSAAPGRQTEPCVNLCAVIPPPLIHATLRRYMAATAANLLAKHPSIRLRLLTFEHNRKIAYSFLDPELVALWQSRWGGPPTPFPISP